MSQCVCRCVLILLFFGFWFFIPTLVKIGQLMRKRDLPDLEQHARRQRQPLVAKDERLAEPAKQMRQHEFVVERVGDVAKRTARVARRPQAAVGRVAALWQRLAERRIDVLEQRSCVVEILRDGSELLSIDCVRVRARDSLERAAPPRPACRAPRCP